MPVELIPLTAPLEHQSDKIGLSLYNKTQQDGYFDLGIGPTGEQVLMWVKRPGLASFVDLGEAPKADGLHFWQRQNLALATCNGKTFKLTETGAKTEITGTASMVAGTRPTYTDVQGTNIYQASGGRIGQFSTTTGLYIADADAPTTVTHLGCLNKTLIGLVADSDQFEWAETNDPTNWTGQSAQAESAPDLARALHVANREIYIPGDTNLEVWYDDGAGYSPESRAVDRGIIAPYSFTIINGVCYWLDHNAEAVAMEGRVPVPLSPLFNKGFQRFGTVSDALGDYYKVDGKNFWVLTFPIGGRTLVYDIDLNRWYEWGYYNALTAQYEAFLGNCMCRATGWRKVLVGDRRTGVIYTMSADHTTDNGDIIRSVLRTDFIDRGTKTKTKTCSELRFYLKRADTATTPNKLTLRWRDNGKTEIAGEREIPIEMNSGTDLIARTHQLGTYEMRQWEIIMDDPAVSALVAIEEVFEYGR